MANYDPSNLKVGQAALLASFQRAEMRFRDPVVWKSMIANAPLSVPNAEQLRTREDRAYEVDFFKRTPVALGSARSHNHTGTKSDTAIITPSFSTYSRPFYTSIKQADNNTKTLQEMFNHELENAAIDFTEGLETAAATYLFNNRSQVNGVTVEGSFDGINYVFDVGSADRAMQITRSTMDILKYQNPAGLDLYCDTVAYNSFEYDRSQGGGNNNNLSFQFDSGVDTFYHVPELNSLAAGISKTNGFWIAVPKGMAVALDWIPKQNRMGVDMGSVAQYGNILNPIDSATYAIHKYWEGADETANNGYTQDVKEEYELSIDVAFELAPLTVANETVAQAFAL